MLRDYLPAPDGLLPYWLLLASIAALGNCIQSYVTTSFTKRVYLGRAPAAGSSSSSAPGSTKKHDDDDRIRDVSAGGGPPTADAIAMGALSPATPLSARTFGTWTATSAVVRGYAAYHVRDPGAYRLALATFAIAMAHFYSEWLYFGTARWGKGLAGPLVVSMFSAVWMWAQWDYYLG